MQLKLIVIATKCGCFNAEVTGPLQITTFTNSNSLNLNFKFQTGGRLILFLIGFFRSVFALSYTWQIGLAARCALYFCGCVLSLEVKADSTV